MRRLIGVTCFTFFVVASLLVQPRSVWCGLAEYERLDLSLHSCKSERGPNSFWHSQSLDRAHGKHIVFVGDSITRYQYLELAYYLAYGECPDPNSGKYILSERDKQGWDDFYNVTTTLLNFETSSVKTREVCMCSRNKLVPGQVIEDRYFWLEDVLGHRISLSYLQYFNEGFRQLKPILSSLEIMKATDVMINFGAWLWDTDETCGSSEDMGNSVCPSVPWLCEFFHQEHSFRLWWLGTTPQFRDGKIVWITPEGHHLDIPSICQLPKEQVIDRYGVIKTLNEKEETQHKLFFGGGLDSVHFDAVANHAFNRLALLRLPSVDVEPKSNHLQQKSIWKLMFRA